MDDIGKWVRGVLSKSNEYKDQSINIAGEALTGQEMAMTLQKIVLNEGIKTNYVMIPRIALKLLEYDIGVMADWIERSGYGADMNMLRKIQEHLNIVPTTFESWIKTKIENKKKRTNPWASQWESSQWNLKLDKQ